MGKRNEFDPSRHKERKYGTVNLDFLSKEEYDRRHSEIKKIISTTLEQWDENWADRGENPVVGVLLFGSWERGDVHTKSDIDIWVLLRTENAWNSVESFFVMELNSNGLESVSCGFSNFSVVNDFEKLSIDIHDPVLGNGFELITPHEWVEEKIKLAKGPMGKAEADAYQKKLEKNYSEW